MCIAIKVAQEGLLSDEAITYVPKTSPVFCPIAINESRQGAKSELINWGNKSVSGCPELWYQYTKLEI